MSDRFLSKLLKPFAEAASRLVKDARNPESPVADPAMSRRSFLKAAVAAGAVLALPENAAAFSLNSLKRIMDARKVVVAEFRNPRNDTLVWFAQAQDDVRDSGFVLGSWNEHRRRLHNTFGVIYSPFKDPKDNHYGVFHRDVPRGHTEDTEFFLSGTGHSFPDGVRTDVYPETEGVYEMARFLRGAINGIGDQIPTPLGASVEYIVVPHMENPADSPPHATFSGVLKEDVLARTRMPLSGNDPDDVVNVSVCIERATRYENGEPRSVTENKVHALVSSGLQTEPPILVRDLPVDFFKKDGPDAQKMDVFFDHLDTRSKWGEYLGWLTGYDPRAVRTRDRRAYHDSKMEKMDQVWLAHANAAYLFISAVVKRVDSHVQCGETNTERCKNLASNEGRAFMLESSSGGSARPRGSLFRRAAPSPGQDR